jgi:DNA polymerase-3 subunit delta
VAGYINDKGFGSGQKALQVGVESVGSEISNRSNEIDKTVLNLKKGEEITADHIQKYIGVSKDYNVFELQKALGTKDVLKANRIINYFEKNPKSNPLIPTLALIYSYYSKILTIYGVKDQSDGNLARVLGVSPYFLKDYKIAKTKYTAGKLIRIFSYLREADLRVKGVSSGNLTDADILRELVFKIIH